LVSVIPEEINFEGKDIKEIFSFISVWSTDRKIASASASISRLE